MSAVIPINATYRIELDTFHWAVARYKPRKNKSEKQWEQISWHGNLQQAGEALQKRLIAEDELEGVDDILSALHASAALIASAIKDSGTPDSWLVAGKCYSRGTQKDV